LLFLFLGLVPCRYAVEPVKKRSGLCSCYVSLAKLARP
jgi:hypothetical protein